MALLEKASIVQQSALDLLGQEIVQSVEIIESLTELNTSLQETVNQILDDVEALEVSVASIGALEAELDQLAEEVEALQSISNLSVAELIDPCGPHTDSDEILLKLADGSIIAYFQQGNNRHLAVLEPGNYQTTDAQKCNFTITASGEYQE